MSLERLTKKELVRTAEEDFAVDVSNSSTKKEIIEELENNGVTFEMYAEANPEKAAKLEEKDSGEDNVVRKPEAQEEELYEVHRPEKRAADKPENAVLVKMTRKNPYFEIRGYRFSQAHPFQLVKEKDVDFLTVEMDGFRMATPSEVSEYYD